MRGRLFSFVLLGLLIAPSVSFAAPLEYSTLTELRKDMAVFDKEGLEVEGAPEARFACDKAFASCTPYSTSTYPSYATMLGADTFFLSDARDRALVRFGTSTPAWKLYRTTDTSAEYMMDVPWAFPVRNVLFAASGKAVLIGGGYVGLFDESSKQFSAIAAKNLAGAARLSVSPDGRFVTYYLASPATGGTRRHALFDILANKEYRTTGKVDYWDLLSEDTKLFDWSPDGTLFYLDDKGGYPWLYAVDPSKLKGATLAGKQLMSMPYSVNDFMPWSKNEVYFSANRENPLQWNLYRYNLVTKKLTKIATDVTYGNLLRRFNDQLLFYEIRGNGKTPMLYDPATGTTKAAPLPLAPRVDAASREAVKLGGVWGALWKPDNYNPAQAYPVLVWLHGGPYRGTMAGYHSYVSYAGYDEMLEALRKQGVVILKLNYRGSYGQGRAFAESIVRNVGKGDVQDVANAVTALKARMKVADVHVMGNSYGGYLAPRVIVEKPTMFKTATLVNGVTDWQRLLARLGNSIFNTQFKGAPGKANAALYAQASIASRITRLTPDNKILIIYGTADETIPNSESTLFYDQLVAAGKNVDIAAYEGEGHTIDKKSALTDICTKVLVMVKGAGACVIE